jgi:hypothetical protein
MVDPDDNTEKTVPIETLRTGDIVKTPKGNTRAVRTVLKCHTDQTKGYDGDSSQRHHQLVGHAVASRVAGRRPHLILSGGSLPGGKVPGNVEDGLY